jgi:hypothetical protein
MKLGGHQMFLKIPFERMEGEELKELVRVTMFINFIQNGQLRPDSNHEAIKTQ